MPLETSGSTGCGWACLGALTFDSYALGDQVTLSQDRRKASRSKTTFRDGLVFSSRPVRVNERVRLRVENHVAGWQGALRVGFTTVPPRDRSLPLPQMAIPNLTDIPGHWAKPIQEKDCHAGSELEFWVSRGGTLYLRIMGFRKVKALEGVNLGQPRWAMVDVYGQTTSVLLLGSEQRVLMGIRRSCPAPKHLPLQNMADHSSVNHANEEQTKMVCENGKISLRGRLEKCASDSEASKHCVVCMAAEASVTLLCGHRCLCLQCSFRVIREFGTCPLCRRPL